MNVTPRFKLGLKKYMCALPNPQSTSTEIGYACGNTNKRFKTT